MPYKRTKVIRLSSAPFSKERFGEKWAESMRYWEYLGIVQREAGTAQRKREEKGAGRITKAETNYENF